MSAHSGAFGLLLVSLTFEIIQIIVFLTLLEDGGSDALRSSVAPDFQWSRAAAGSWLSPTPSPQASVRPSLRERSSANRLSIVLCVVEVAFRNLRFLYMTSGMIPFYFPKYFSPSCDLHPSSCQMRDLWANGGSQGHIWETEWETYISEARPAWVCFQGRMFIPVRQKERSVWASVLYRTSCSSLSPGFWAFTRTWSTKKWRESSNLTPLCSPLKFTHKPPKWWLPSPLASLPCSSPASLWYQPTRSSPSLLICTRLSECF